MFSAAEGGELTSTQRYSVPHFLDFTLLRILLFASVLFSVQHSAFLFISKACELSSFSHLSPFHSPALSLSLSLLLFFFSLTSSLLPSLPPRYPFDSFIVTQTTPFRITAPLPLLSLFLDLTHHHVIP
jgi:uncharacterized BrkB/YihY/UPF0761 family membrane protein